MTRALDTAKIQQNSGGSVAPFIAGKNKLINSDFSIWQRGTSFTLSTGVSTLTTDRWHWIMPGGTVVSRQTFTPGSAPVSGYEGQYYVNTTINTNAQYYEANQKVEDARTFAGQIVTLSFWARSTVGAQTMNTLMAQDFGTGGSPSSMAFASLVSSSTGTATYTPTSTWTRYWFTYSFPSVSGKTFGTNNNSFLLVRPLQFLSTNTNTSIDIWGVQLEAGSVATPFTTATGSIGSELSLCKRYYERHSASSTQGYAPYAAGYFNFATAANYAYKFESEKRAQPTISFGPSVAQFQAGFNGNQAQAANTLTAANISRHGCYITLVPNGTPFTAGQATTLQDAGSAVSYIEISAEL